MITGNESIWEHSSCDWCGSTETDLIFEGPDRLHRLPGVFSMRRCRRCGILRQEPRLTWSYLSTYYPENYSAYNYNTWETNSPIIRRMNNYGNVKRRRFVEKHQTGGRLLEVGCGTGAFLRELARSSKWELEGLEPSIPAAEFASKTLAVPIHHERLSKVDLKPVSYDAIVLWCVLEHLGQPLQDLRRIYSLLKDGGWLFFSMPNVESLAARMFGPFWSGWDLPRHLYIFPRPILHNILEQIGFGFISERCISTSYHTLGHSLDFWSQSWESRHPRIRQLMVGLYHTWFVRMGLFLPLALLDRLKLSTNITIAAQKLNLPS
jgi:SAM-dependent methyltransferase